MGSLLLSPGSWSTYGFVFSFQESISPVLWEFYNQIPLTFKVTSPGDSQSLCQIPRFGSLLWALELSQQHENFFGIVVLQFVSCLPGGSMVELMVTSSKRIYATCHASQVCCHQSPSCPHSRPLLTHASAEDPPTLKGRSGSVSCGDHCSFPWVLVYTSFCLCPLSVSGGY